MLFDSFPTHARGWRTFYHVTHRDYVRRIRRLGLEPAMSIRKARRVWLADLIALPWAIAHVTSTHGWTREEIVILRITVPRDELTLHRQGVYYTKARIPGRFVGFGLACQY
jgi:hypothetical protein